MTTLYKPVLIESAEQAEVSEVVGFEVSEGEIDLMLDEKPVRDVYYIRDGNTLVVEER